MSVQPDVVTTLLEHLEIQRLGCVLNGSSLYGEVLEVTKADVADGGPSSEILFDWADAPFGDAIVLRFLAAVHRLVLDGRAPALAGHYPSAGGRPGRGLGDDFLATVAAHRSEIAARMADGVQTNEVGRSVSLLGGYLAVAASGLPLRVLEVGASAGLNLRFDHYRYVTARSSFGPEQSPVRFEHPWAGAPPPLTVPCEVVERRGSDVAPIDPATAEGRIALRSFVWPDLVDRLDRLDAAITVAGSVPAPVERADAAAFLAEHLADPVADVATVVVHSIMFQYLSSTGRRAMLAVLGDAGRRASARAPLAWLRMEPGGDHAEVRLTTWPGHRSWLIATSSYHGPPVRWLGPR